MSKSIVSPYSLYEETFEEIIRKSDNKEKGILEGIPFPFPKLAEYIPTIEKGVHIGILGSTGVGKSTYARFMYIYHTVKFAIENNYPLKVLFFSIEDAKKKVMKKIMNHYLYEHYGESVGYSNINSQFVALSKYRQDCIRKDEIFYKRLLDIVYIIDGASSPTQISQACDLAQEKGVIKDNDHVIVVVDNYDNITPDAQDRGDKWTALNRLSHHVIRLDLCKKRDYTCVSILQQDMEQEKHSFRGAAKGNVGIASIEPSMASIAGSKEVARHMHQLYGIFNPWKYEIEHYPHKDGWNTSILRNKFRSFLVLKQNDTEIPYGRLGLMFNGLTEMIEELPRFENREEMEKIYEQVRREEAEKRLRFSQKLF